MKFNLDSNYWLWGNTIGNRKAYMFVVFETTYMSGSVYDNVIANHGTMESSVCFGRRNGNGNNMNIRINGEYGSFNQLEGFDWDIEKTYIMYIDFNQSTIPSGDVYAIGSKLYNIDGTPHTTSQSSFSTYTTVTAPGGAPNESFFNHWDGFE